ncbi:MAG: glucosamine-6-phosphate deaminase [Clostridia bacterium]|nr:glucosamine-6-phosphate deaminase [Clostridia bacterium]MBQ3232836.1 glucosamine-6-phosphate deaminase [Clostridia bacterium]MBQ4620756.1 glucosamine-6-phosphate deaminase [Clostridia bacterium]MBQ9857180.1 glucosamine-6-phosphate deaminase [Clostridia bacterium]
MRIMISRTADELGKRAADAAEIIIKDAISKNGEARIILSTGASQFETLKYLTEKDIDWSKVTMFHLDEYVNLPETHPASFRKYLKERFVAKTNVGKAHFVDGTKENIAFLTEEIRKAPVDLGIVGIGVNGHIAFNDPPADFETKEAYIIVDLDETCRNQQVGEGWFKTFDDVPKQAVSMSVYQIMQCKNIVTAVPHAEKAWAIENTLKGELSNTVPATMLKMHDNWQLFTDANSHKDAKEIKEIHTKAVVEDYR